MGNSVQKYNQNILSLIFTIRGKQVMIDEDLADLYGIETKYLNRAVKRNPERFPKAFMFQLTKEEYEALRFQIGTLKTGRGQHRKYLPFAFTEQGVAMLTTFSKMDKGSCKIFDKLYVGSSIWKIK